MFEWIVRLSRPTLMGTNDAVPMKEGNMRHHYFINRHEFYCSTVSLQGIGDGEERKSVL